jgi:hypothetical protein
MRKMFLLVVVAIAATASFGQGLIGNNGDFSIGVNYSHEFVVDGFVRVREWELPGDKMKLRDLGIKSLPALQLNATKTFTKGRSVSLIYDHFFISGESTFDRDIAYNGTIINGRDGINVSPSRYFRVSAIYSAPLVKRQNFSLLYTAGLVLDHITFYLDGQVASSSERDEVFERFGRQSFPYPVIGLKGTHGMGPKSSIQWETSGTYVPKFKSFYTEGGNVFLQYSNFQADVKYSRAISDFDVFIGARLRYMHLFQESMEDTNVINTFTIGPFAGVRYHF